MILYFVRHGETDWNVAGKIQGSYDSQLNETGIKQAEDLGNLLKDSNRKIHKIYTSKQSRALTTAKIISENTAVPYEDIPGLEEVNLGLWEGLSWREVRSTYPAEYDEWYKQRRYTKAPNGESYQDVLERVLIALKQIITDNTEDILIVTHSAVIMVLQCFITDTPFQNMGNFKMDNAQLVEIDSKIILSLLS